MSQERLRATTTYAWMAQPGEEIASGLMVLTAPRRVQVRLGLRVGELDADAEQPDRTPQLEPVEQRHRVVTDHHGIPRWR